jgi:predicted nuclease of predicted toxin-antitoxin system
MEALKFVADEGVEKEIVLALRHSYDVIYIAEVSPSIPDEAILHKASEENRILITLDKDFGELVFRLNKIHTGVVLCRLQSLPVQEAAILLKDFIARYGSDLYGAFTVIQPKKIRIRKR